MTTQGAYISSAATSLVTTAETAILTFSIPPENQGPTGQGIYLDVNAVLTTGAAATAVVLRLRQGNGVGGAIVGQPCQTQVAAAQANAIASAAALDPQTSYPAGNTYTVTAQQVGATGNGTMQQVTASVAPVTSAIG